MPTATHNIYIPPAMSNGTFGCPILSQEDKFTTCETAGPADTTHEKQMLEQRERERVYEHERNMIERVYGPLTVNTPAPRRQGIICSVLYSVLCYPGEGKIEQGCNCKFVSIVITMFGSIVGVAYVI